MDQNHTNEYTPEEIIEEFSTYSEPEPDEELDTEAHAEFDSEPVFDSADAPTAPPVKKARFSPLFIALTSVFLVLALAVVGVVGYVYFVVNPYEDYPYILPNVYCAGVALEGMTEQEAQEAIEEALRNPSYSVTVTLPDCSYEFQPRQEGITLNGASIAQKAFAYKRSDTSAYGMYKAYREAKKTEYQLSAETALDYNKEDIQALAVQIFQETEILPTDSVLADDQENHIAGITLGTPGRRIEPQVIFDAVCTAFDTMDFSEITLEYSPVEIDMTQIADLAEDAEDAMCCDPVQPYVYADTEVHTIDVTMGTPGYTMKATDLVASAKAAVESGAYGTATLNLTEIPPDYPDVTEAYNALVCDPTTPYYYNGVVYEGSCGYSLDWDTAAQLVDAAAYGEMVSIPMTEIPPELTAAEVEAVLFRDKLSSYSTPHTADAGRTTNLKLACQAINGTVLNPGETFSFNGTVGQRTADKGYQEAIVYVGTKSVGEVGGGICQVASTIYDAVLYADLEVTQRAPHTFIVTYVPGGLDATVYWGSQDFCFRNDTDYPVAIYANVSGGYVNISIWGTKLNDNYVKLDYRQLSSVPYSCEVVYSSALPAGTSKVTQTPYTGYTYEAYQYVYDGNGNLLETNYLGKSTYQKRNQITTIGTG